MSKVDDGGAAFPRHGHTDPATDKWIPAQEGMTLRDWFAGQALAGWVAKYGSDVASTDAALCAWEYADAMLEARTQEVQP